MLQIEDLEINDVKLIKTNRFLDDRGFFQQNYQYDEYSLLGIKNNFVQDNWSFSKKGVLRGLHYQVKFSQAKLVQVLSGSVFDVVVDLRMNSSTYGKWVGRTLSDKNGYQLYVPKEFAHGFLVLESNTTFIYKCDSNYKPEYEYGIKWDDPTINIKWPNIDVDYIISKKDKELPKFKEIKHF